MKKFLVMFAMLLVCSIASAQKDTTASRKSDKHAQKERAAMKSQTSKNSQPGTTATRKKGNTTATPKKRERANGTTGVQEFPETEGAGTGTGNDSRVAPPPGQPEKLGTP